MQLLAVELDFDIADTADDLADFESIRELLREEIRFQKDDAIEHFNELERQLNVITINQLAE
jgi:hypothetical protein